MRVFVFLAWSLPVLVLAEVKPLFLRFPDPETFRHFECVNPEAPKGGTLNLAGRQPFETLNPFGLRGRAPVFSFAGSQDYEQLLFQTLMVRSLDDPESFHGLVARALEVGEDFRIARFVLDPRARWHDGLAVEPEDVVRSFEILRSKGHPRFRDVLRGIHARSDDHRKTVVFDLSETSSLLERENSLRALALLPLVPKAWIDPDVFVRVQMDAPLGTGPYQIAEVDPRRRIVFRRVRDHWASDHPVYRGRFNFDEIAVTFIADEVAELMSFQRGDVDLRQDWKPENWAQAARAAGARRGQIVNEAIRLRSPAPFFSFAFNLRRPYLEDRRTREALALAFDRDWVIASFLHGLYRPTRGLFPNSPYETRDDLPGPKVKKWLEDAQASPEAFQGTDGFGVVGTQRRRAALIKAVGLLKEAGWVFKDRKLFDAAGKPLRLELLSGSPSFTRFFGPYVEDLKRLGAEARIRETEPGSFRIRRDAFDFDIIATGHFWNQPPILGLNHAWGSEWAHESGAENYAGIEDPVVDRILQKLEAVWTRDEMGAGLEALERVILSEHYVIPLWYNPDQWISYWRKLARPQRNPWGSPGYVDTWWVKESASSR